MSSGSSGEDSRHRLSLQNKEAFIGTCFKHVWKSKIYELPKLVLDRYIFDLQIESGSFGAVYDVFDTETKQFVVAKILNVRCITK